MPVRPLNMSTFQQLVDSSPVMVVRFSAQWCGPCRMYNPIFERVASRHASIPFGAVDIDKERDVAKYFRVTSVPTTVFIKDARVVDTVTGVLSEKDLEDRLRNLLPR